MTDPMPTMLSVHMATLPPPDVAELMENSEVAQHLLLTLLQHEVEGDPKFWCACDAVVIEGSDPTRCMRRMDGEDLLCESCRGGCAMGVGAEFVER